MHLKKIHSKLVNLSAIKFIIVITLSQILIRLPLIPILLIIGNDDAPNLQELHDSIPFLITALLIVIVAPFLETIIFQWGVIKISHNMLYLNKTIAIILSALIFAIAHTYNVWYIINTFLTGLIYAYAFCIYEYYKKARRPNAVLVITLIHAINNCMALIISFI